MYKIKTKYDKKQNLLFAILIGAVAIATAGLTYGLTKKLNSNENKINEVEKNLIDIENMLAKKEAVVLYDYTTSNSSDIDIYWNAKYIEKSIVEDYSFIYVKYNLFSYSGENYWPSSVCGDTLLKTETFLLNLEKNGNFYDSSVINGMYFANLSISNGSDDNIDCYSFSVATLGTNGNSSQSAFISSIIGIY